MISTQQWELFVIIWQPAATFTQRTMTICKTAQNSWTLPQNTSALRRRSSFALGAHSHYPMCVWVCGWVTNKEQHGGWKIQRKTSEREFSKWAERQARISEGHCFGGCRCALRGAARSQSPLHANTQEPADNTHERTERRITHSLTHSRALSRPLCVRLKIATWLWVADGRPACVYIYICVFGPDR